METLRRVFRLEGFRPGQAEAIAAVESGRDVQVLLPTGGGKSLCYQLPAARSPRPSLVVSPLIALMEDQVASLRARGVPAVALHSGVPRAEQRAAMAEAEARGALIYASPERVALPGFRRWLARLGLSMAAVDEAHCISEWGHDFRKDYLRLAVLKEELGLPVMALTATATPRVMEEIRRSLGLVDPLVIRGDFVRPNLRFAVEPMRGDKARASRVLALLGEEGLGEPGGPRAVVYAATRKRVQALCAFLRSAGIAAGYYHAGRTDGARSGAQGAYEEGRRPVLVATTAFGMGVDHPDVRLVVHAEAPGSLEAYYQQAGRAGRDGAPARCVLLYAPKDALTQARLRGRSAPPGAEAGWRALQDYVFDTGCRQRALVRWFTADPGAQCGSCDACLRPGPVEEAVAAMRADLRQKASQRQQEALLRLEPDQEDLVVAFVEHLKKPVGKRLVALGLRGSRAKPVLRRGLVSNPYHGALEGIAERALVAAVERLLEEGRLAPRGRKYPTVWLPDKAVRAPSSGKPRPRRGFADPVAQALANLRRREARRLRWKPYQVFDNATLQAIAAERPRTLAELEAVRGMGPKRVARFGAAILAIF